MLNVADNPVTEANVSLRKVRWYVLLALLLAALTLGSSTSASAASVGTEPTKAQSIAAAERLIADTPSGAVMSQSERLALAESFYAMAQDMKRSALSRSDIAQPDWSIGLGWYIYFHHLTPNDQRWFLEVGVTVVAGVICAVSGFNPAVCTISAVAGAVLVSTISHYYSPSYCLEIQLNYSGSLHKAYRTKC